EMDGQILVGRGDKLSQCLYQGFRPEAGRLLELFSSHCRRHVRRCPSTQAQGAENQIACTITSLHRRFAPAGPAEGRSSPSLWVQSNRCATTAAGASTESSLRPICPAGKDHSAVSSPIRLAGSVRPPYPRPPLRPCRGRRPAPHPASHRGPGVEARRRRPPPAILRVNPSSAARGSARTTRRRSS